MADNKRDSLGIRVQFTEFKVDNELIGIAFKAYDWLTHKRGYVWDIEFDVQEQPTTPWSNSRQKLDVALSLLEKNGWIEKGQDGRYSAL